MTRSLWIHRHRVLATWPSPSALLLSGLLCASSTAAWAYKVEKICTDVAATASEPAKKICKIVRVDPNKESAPKEEKKEEKKHGGH